MLLVLYIGTVVDRRRTLKGTIVTTGILIRFPNAGLINIGGDDAKLVKLQETTRDLAATLKITPSKAATFALIAFDPKAPAEDPVIREAVDALQKRWATYVNTFSGTPVAVIRAMLLDALVQAAGEEDKVGVAFVSSARNALPSMEAGNERAIWAEAVDDIERWSMHGPSPSGSRSASPFMFLSVHKFILLSDYLRVMAQNPDFMNSIKIS